VRISRELLIDLARRETERRGADNDVLSGYLIGSVARGEPQFGDNSDIDLVLIHKDSPPAEREMMRLSQQVHLDIAHHGQDLYLKPSALRIHPWLGPSLCEPIFLYDPEHFLEWAQAGARGQYYRVDHTHARARAFLDRARQSTSLLPVSSRWVRTYCRAVHEAANAVACLTGFPVAGRRLSLQLNDAAQSLEYPELYGGFLQLLGSDSLQDWSIPETLSAWARTFDDASDISSDPLLSSCRRDYHLNAFQVLVEMGEAKAILWFMLSTWEQALHALNQNENPEQPHAEWLNLLENLGLSAERQSSRMDALEHYLDRNEAFLEVWAERNGV
jgi:predicted nucleotidyltransferase